MKPTLVTVFSTDKDAFHKTGSPMQYTEEQAESLVKRGLATREAVEEKETESTQTKKTKSK